MKSLYLFHSTDCFIKNYSSLDTIFLDPENSILCYREAVLAIQYITSNPEVKAKLLVLDEDLNAYGAQTASTGIFERVNREKWVDLCLSHQKVIAK